MPLISTLSEMRRMIREYGAAAVLGRAMGVCELRELNYAERITFAYHARESAENWAEWVKTNPGDSALLNWAMRLSNESN